MSDAARFTIRAYTKKELATFYTVSTKSFTTWLKPFRELIGRKIGRYYSPQQVRKIIQLLGLPGTAGE